MGGPERGTLSGLRIPTPKESLTRGGYAPRVGSRRAKTGLPPDFLHTALVFLPPSNHPASTPVMKRFAAAVALLAMSVNAHAQDLTKEEITKQREALLLKMEELANRRLQAGEATSDEVKRARLSLLKFRQENAGAPAERIAFQEKIIETQRERLREAESRFERGDGDKVECLRAEDRVLRAKQRLLKMKSKE